MPFVGEVFNVTQGSLLLIFKTFRVDTKSSEPEESPSGFCWHWDLFVFIYFSFFGFWLCAFFFQNFHLIEGYALDFPCVFNLRKIVLSWTFLFQHYETFPKKNRINFRKRDILYLQLGKLTVVPESYVYLLGYFRHWDLNWLCTYLLFDEKKCKLRQNIYNHQLTDS